MRAYMETLPERMELREVMRPQGTNTLDGAIPPPIDPAKALEVYFTSPVLTAIGSLVAESLSGARVDWAGIQEDEAGYQAVREKWATTAWYWGGVPISWPEWVRLAVESLEATGNLYLEVGDGMVNILAPQYSTFYLENGRVYLAYTPPIGNSLRLPPWVPGDTERGYLHAAHRTIYHALYGLPPWIGARDSVEVDIAHRRYLQGFFLSAGTPRYLTRVYPSPDAAVGEEVADQIGAMLADFFRASAGKALHRNMVFSHPAGINVEITPLEARTQDPTFSTLSRTVLQEVLMVRHVSMLHLGITEGGYRATADEQARMLSEYLLKPVGRLITSALDRAFGVHGWSMEFVVEPSRATIDLIEAAVKAAGVSILTPDEARALLGYEPMGDNRLWRPAGMYPEGGGELAPLPGEEVG